MAALGWLVSLADKEQPDADDESSRDSRGRAKTPGDVHAIWNWFYLCVIRDDNAGAFEAGRETDRGRAARSAGSLGVSARTRGQKHSPGPAVCRFAFARRKRTSSPSKKAEVDRVITCFRELRARRPELAQAEIILSKMTDAASL